MVGPQVKRVAILGLGNVALDCARMILQPPQRLAATDTAPHALEQLKRSSIEQVDVIGRRGAAQVSGTAPYSQQSSSLHIVCDSWSSF